MLATFVHRYNGKQLSLYMYPRSAYLHDYLHIFLGNIIMSPLNFYEDIPSLKACLPQYALCAAHKQSMVFYHIRKLAFLMEI